MVTPADRSAAGNGVLGEEAERWAAKHLPGLLTKAGEQAAEMITAILRDELVAAAMRQVSVTAGKLDSRPGPEAEAVPPATAGSPPGEARATRAVPQSACYVYGVMPTDAAGGLQMAEPSVSPVTVEDIAALVTYVDAADYGPDRIQDKLSDEVWVEQRARDHDLVLRAAMACGPVLPFRFLTVVTNKEAVLKLLRQHHAALRDGLESVTGHQEWGLRMLQDRKAMAHSLDGGPERSPGQTGTEWLAARQRRQQLEDDIDAVAAALVDECHTRLADVAGRSLVRPADRRPGADGRTTVLNASYLVADAAVDAFRGLAEEIDRTSAEVGLHLELTGPWPPYSFVEIEL